MQLPILFPLEEYCHSGFRPKRAAHGHSPSKLRTILFTPCVPCCLILLNMNCSPTLPMYHPVDAQEKAYRPKQVRRPPSVDLDFAQDFHMGVASLEDCHCTYSRSCPMFYQCSAVKAESFVQYSDKLKFRGLYMWSGRMRFHG